MKYEQFLCCVKPLGVNFTKFRPMCDFVTWSPYLGKAPHPKGFTLHIKHEANVIMNLNIHKS
jgi:hypothetical protein